MALFQYFWNGILRRYCHIGDEYPKIFPKAKFRAKMKIPEFAAKKSLIWVSLGWNLKIILCYLKPALSIFLIVKFCERIKIYKFRAKNALFGYFWFRIYMTFIIFEIRTLELVKNEFLTYTVNFSIVPAFSNGPRSAFSEGPSPGLKVFCLLAQTTCTLVKEIFV